MLYEDLKLEVAGLNVPQNKEFDEVSRHYREMYFVRRAFATLWEMDSAFHKLNMLKEFKARKRCLDRRRLKAWTAAVMFFSRTKRFIDNQRNAYGGHVTDDLARFVLSKVEKTDDTVGALEVKISDDHTNHLVFKFAETIVSNALFVDRGERDHAAFLTESLQILCLANIASGQKSLTLWSPLGTLQAMRGGFTTRATVRTALATRTDLLLKTLALRHQLGVLARSKRRFRPADRLLWLFLRWLWPRWREALVLVLPATVDRWNREGLRRCWRRRSRRPGRPCIDSPCRDLIRRIAAENCLWGAPRIHGELLKLGVATSERTVSRYLRGRPTTRSQTWRTFVANHLGDRTFISPVMFAHARSDDIVVDGFDLSSRPTPLSIDGSCTSIHWASVDWGPSLQYSFLACVSVEITFRTVQALKNTGRDPPRHLRLQLASQGFIRARPQCLCDQRHCDHSPREFAIGNSGSPFLRNRVVNVGRKAEHFVRPARWLFAT